MTHFDSDDNGLYTKCDAICCKYTNAKVNRSVMGQCKHDISPLYSPATLLAGINFPVREMYANPELLRCFCNFLFERGVFFSIFCSRAAVSVAITCVYVYVSAAVCCCRCCLFARFALHSVFLDGRMAVWLACGAVARAHNGRER